MTLLSLRTLNIPICLTASLLMAGCTGAVRDFQHFSRTGEFFKGQNSYRVSGQNVSSHTLSDSESSQAIREVRYQEVVAATQGFLALLDEEQRAAVVLPFDSPYRTRTLCYSLARCKDNPGLRMSALNPTQKIALNNVLMKSYSSAGYSRAIQTMNREWLLEEMENAHEANPEQYPVVGSPEMPDWSPPPQRGAPDYYVAFFGEPNASADPTAATDWGVRFEGHHLSLNLTFDGQSQDPKIGASPMFFGSSPMIVPQSPALGENGEKQYPRWQTEEGQQMLNREAWLARSFLKSLDAQAIETGGWSNLPDAALRGGIDAPLDAASYLEGEKPGILVSDLSPLQQDLLLDFAQEFLQMQENQEIEWEVFKQTLGESRVWWFGDIENEQAELYIRVQSDRYLVELLQSNTFGLTSDIAANHIHSSFRDLRNDWDYDSLSDHLAQYHAPAVPH